ncbi:probable leucine-rich repeat receptor-like protein kinase At1g35710 [Impatiens glandulifera]|uniref:probable leucine-rich repeat receptor-like protein kinase At1g35710 n=1 Tax=Impatiens glandulifera TaxID=253017 RepID=UPI001FB1904B|nr:probable leucine-rich repeat receptor-like protein kinase At1g35710 [Impatiens glandulifera]
MGVGEARAFANEIKTLTQTRHRNIVKLYGFCSHERETFLVSELLENGSLDSVLGSEKLAKELIWEIRIRIVKGVVDALCYLHHSCVPPIIHRDISSKNILLDKEFEAHVSDFGTSKFLKPNSSNWTTVAGTYGYIAPELAYTPVTTEKCDVYSFGVLALEILYGSHPHELISKLSSNQVKILLLDDALDRRLAQPLGQELEDELKCIINLAVCCLNSNPQARPSMDEVSKLLQVKIDTNYPPKFGSETATATTPTTDSSYYSQESKLLQFV